MQSVVRQYSCAMTPSSNRKLKSSWIPAVDINTGAWKIYNAIDVHRDDNGIYTAKVVVKNEYTGKLLEEFFKLVNNKDKNVNINAVGKWTKVGVAAKTVKGNMYIAIVVQVNPNA